MVDQHATAAQGTAQPAPPSSIETTTTTTTYLASANGGAVRRIRTPHPHDVLSGRGGGINGHPGNVRFREWVRVRKSDYNLALNKAEKAEVAREVIQQVLDQSPPGRFLQKDPSSVGAVGWWIELDDERVLAKTAQALREGAPLIRAEHRDDRLHPQSHSHSHRASSPSSPHKRHATTAVPQLPPVVDAAVEQLRANALAAAAVERPPAAKRVRVDYNGHVLHPTDETPPLLPAPHPHLPDNLGLLEELGGNGSALFPPPASFPARPAVGHGNGGNLKRVHSLALSDVSWGEWATEDFVNPFEGDELRRLEAIRTGHSTTTTAHGHHHHHDNRHHSRVRPGVMFTRESSSNSSHGDLGGLATLLGSGPLDHQPRRTSSSSISSNTNTHGRPEEFGERGVASGVRDDNSNSNSSKSPSIWNSRYDEGEGDESNVTGERADHGSSRGEGMLSWNDFGEGSHSDDHEPHPWFEPLVFPDRDTEWSPPVTSF